MRRKISLIFALIISAAFCPVLAQDVCLAYQKGTPLFEETAEVVKMSVSPKSFFPVEKDKEEEAKTAISIEKDSLICAIGPSAITNAFHAGSSKGVAVGLPNPLSKAYSAKKDYSFVALYPEPKSVVEYFSRTIAAKTIGVIYTNSVNQEMGDYFKAQIEASGAKCKTLGVDTAQDLVAPFPFFLGQVDVALLLIDPISYNKEAVKFMVTKAIEKKKPICGFSEQVPSSGIPLALFVPSGSLAESVSRAVKDKKAGTAQPLYFPASFKISINQEAVKAIGVKYDEGKVATRY